MGESFGGGIVVKLMCVSPEKISKSILLMPAGIYNSSKSKLILSMGFPMMMYLLAKKESWFNRTFSPMATEGETIDAETLEMFRLTFHHVKINPNMPSNVSKKSLVDYKAPTLLLAGENDVLFPGRKLIARSREIM